MSLPPVTFFSYGEVEGRRLRLLRINHCHEQLRNDDDSLPQNWRSDKDVTLASG